MGNFLRVRNSSQISLLPSHNEVIFCIYKIWKAHLYYYPCRYPVNLPTLYAGLRTPRRVLYQLYKCWEMGPKPYASLWFFWKYQLVSQNALFNISDNEKLKNFSSRLKILIDFKNTSALRVEIIWLSVDVNTINHPGFPWQSMEIYSV